LGRTPAAFEHSDDRVAVLSRRRREIELKQQLEAAIADERYELAAGLRDEISALEAEEELSI
jgi:protein-arginine kinase activator protein McsA